MTLTTLATFAREVLSGGLAALPSVNTRVTVVPRSGTDDGVPPVEYPSRVEDLRLVVSGRRPGPAELVVARPDIPGNLEGERPGAEYLVRWVTDRGVHEVVGRFVGREKLGPAVLGWRLSVPGPVSRIQRRAHARVDIAVPVLVTVLHDGRRYGSAAGTVLEGTTVNLSEGGVLAELSPHAPQPGATVVVRFEIAGERFVPTGTVVRVQQAHGRLGTPAVAVRFDDPDAHGDRLRPLLFAHQLNGRRVGLI